MSESEDRSRKRHVLVVTNNDLTAEILSRLLSRFSYTAECVRDGNEGLELLRTRDLDCLIAEFLVPGMNAVELLGRARDTKPSIPVLFLIPGSDAAAESQCMGYGAGCIMKPVQAEDLYASLQAALEPRPRASIRIETVLPVHVDDTRVSQTGTRIELSEQGMYLPLRDPGPRGRVAIRLQMGERVIATEAAVLYSQSEPSRSHREPGVGLKFLSLSEQDRQFLRGYIRDVVTAA